MSMILFVVTHSPYEAGLTDEAHDFILTSTAYGHTSQVLFKHEGVYHLLKQQSPPIGQKHSGKRISAYEFFDIEEIYACQPSLNEHQINDEALIENITPVSEHAQKNLLNRAKHIITI